jgi:hypothetical protein
MALVGALLAAGVGFVAFRSVKSNRVPEAAAPTPVRTSITDSPPVASIPPPSASVDIWALGEPEPSAEVSQAFTGYDTLPDGRKVPDLPADAPKRVSFGVIVVSYRGAESASENNRAKPEALTRAKQLAGEAAKDFDATVKEGDRGSTSDAGSIPRGIVEPTVEYILFTLKKGEVYGEPVDTPKGYWIVKRIQ